MKTRVAVVVSDRADAPALARARRAGVEALHVDPRVHPDRVAFDPAILRPSLPRLECTLTNLKFFL